MRRSLLLGVLALHPAACIPHLTVAGWARESAARDLACPEDRLTLTDRPELSNQTYDVDGCGRRARYTCCPRTGKVTCWQEPLP